MKNFCIFSSLFLAAVAFGACSTDEGVDDSSSTPQKVPMTFYASTETDTTKNRIAFSTVPNVVWQNNDAISVLCLDGDNNPENDFFILKSGEGKALGIFSGFTSQSNEYLAVYPHQSGYIIGIKDLKYTIRNAVIPTLQTATNGNFDSGAVLQFANVTTTKSFHFYNVTSLMEITAPFDCNSITIETQGSTPISLTGTATLNFQDGYPVAVAQDNKGSNQVVIRGTIKKDNVYYAAIMPGTTKSFTITYRNGDRSVTEVRGDGSTDIIYNRAKIKKIKKRDATILPASSDLVDLGFPSGTKWSKYNLGATSETELGTKYAWGEVAPKQKYSIDNYRYYSKTPPTTVEDDIASILSGGVLQMPTKTQIQELLDNVTWSLVGESPNYSLKATSKVTGYTDKFIIFPLTARNYWANIAPNNEQASTLFLNVDTSVETPEFSCEVSATAKYEGYYIRPVGQKP